MRLLTAFVLFLLLSSCQQRYWQVKKVKAEKNHSVQKEKSQPEKETETLTTIPSDTLLVAADHPPEISDDDPKARAEVPKAPPIVADRAGVPENEHPLKQYQDLFPDPEDDEPLSSREKLLVLCVFFIWFTLLISLALIPASIVAVLLFFSFLSGALISPTTIAVLLVLAGILIILSLIFSFKFGKKRINIKLGRELDSFELFGYFLFSVLIFLAASSLFVLFLNLPMLALILQYLPSVLFIFAVIYVMMW